MNYFVLHNYCYISWGACKAAVYDVLQKRIFWIEDPEHQLFLKQSQQGMSIEEISRSFGLEENELFQYTDLLRQLDLGTIYDRPKVSTKFRPFVHNHLVEKNGYYRPLSTVTIEMASECKKNCGFCDFKKRFATLECACGCYSDTTRITYNIAGLLKSLSFAKPGRLELMGGDPFTHKEDLYEILKYASEFHIPVTVKTSGMLVEETDIKQLKRNQVHLSLIVTGFNPAKGREEVSGLMRILGWAAKYDFTDLDIVLLLDEHQLKNRDEIQQWLSEYYLTVSCMSCCYPMEMIVPEKSAQLEHLSPFLFTRHYHFAIGIDGLARQLNGHSCWQDRICIMQDGEVRPCIAASDISYGNVNEKNILDIIREGRSTEVIKERNCSVESCSGCEFALGCSSCVIATRKIRGSYQSKAWNCTYQPESGKFGK